MTEFQLDPRLERDTFELGQLNGQTLLLMNNALFPWLILVPRTHHQEVHHLSEGEQFNLLRSANALSQHLLTRFDTMKVNLAAIGNLVPQLHLHVVGRRVGDHAWPGVVWGHPEHVAYLPEQVRAIARGLKADPAVESFTINSELEAGE
ncbi:MAG: HIT family protein [Pseudomonadota bacterium]|nr:HIT family protein [Pseudomonadota bacterium]